MTFHSMDTLDIGVIMNLSRYPAIHSSPHFVHKQDGTLHALKLFKLHLNSEVKICNISKEYYHN